MMLLSTRTIPWYNYYGWDHDTFHHHGIWGAAAELEIREKRREGESDGEEKAQESDGFMVGTQFVHVMKPIDGLAPLEPELARTQLGGPLGLSNIWRSW